MPAGKLALGSAETVYFDEYNPTVLRPIERSIGRATLKLKSFQGFDLWHLYEITFLDADGIPKVCCGTLRIDASSTRIIESKSLKLYILSLTMTKFKDLKELAAVISSDLEKELLSSVEVKLWDLEDCPFTPQRSDFRLIDNTDCLIKGYDYDDSLLQFGGDDKVEEHLRSNVLRTLCPVTGQPDHAEVFIEYKGRRINSDSLFAYLVSLRSHRGFHEQCCELIFSDIMQTLSPDELTVGCAFTRRGGSDITPVRTSLKQQVRELPRTLRQ